MPATKSVDLSSADRVLFPEDGITKGHLFEYYRQVAPVIVPHLKDRPFTMKRYPHGIYGEATTEESKELADEGIECGRIPWLPTTDA